MTKTNEELIEEFHNQFPSRNPDVEPKITDYLRSLLTQKDAEQADWLRSEIEKLEGDRKGLREMLFNYDECRGFNLAIADIITRYKEELKVLESK